MDLVEKGQVGINGEGTRNNSIELESENSADFWEEIEQKLRDVYERGTKAITQIVESFKEDCKNLKELSLSEKLKEKEYASHFYALQKSASFHVLQLLKLDPSLRELLDEFAKSLGKEFMSEKFKTLLDKINHYQDEN